MSHKKLQYVLKQLLNFSFCQDRVKNLTIASFAFIIQFNPSPAEKKVE